MPCGTTHRLINFTATASYLASRPDDQQKGLAHPLIGGTASALLASLPDAIAQKARAESISLKPTNQSPYNRRKP